MNCVAWLFGRGASVACNLRWTVPPEWQSEARDVQVQKVTEAIRAEMDSPDINAGPYRKLLDELAVRTIPGWQHRLFTTNWDFLLQQEVNRLGFKVAPSWLPETHVFHLNGSIEEWSETDSERKERQTSTETSLRSNILLETDSPRERIRSFEVSNALQFIVWRQFFIVIGVSFECPMDQSFLGILKKVQDDLPIGDSCWLIVNPDLNAIRDVCTRVKWAFPRAVIVPIPTRFEQWLGQGMPQLATAKILKEVKM